MALQGQQTGHRVCHTPTQHADYNRPILSWVTNFPFLSDYNRPILSWVTDFPFLSGYNRPTLSWVTNFPFLSGSGRKSVRIAV